jgi:hypothetical protein
VEAATAVAAAVAAAAAVSSMRSFAHVVCDWAAFFTVSSSFSFSSEEKACGFQAKCDNSAEHVYDD